MACVQEELDPCLFLTSQVIVTLLLTYVLLTANPITLRMFIVCNSLGFSSCLGLAKALQTDFEKSSAKLQLEDKKHFFFIIIFLESWQLICEF